MDRLEKITLDREYKGHENLIRDHIINLFQRRGRRAHGDQIVFDEVGKKSPAHEAAIQTFRGKQKPGREILASDVLAEI